MSNKVIKPKTEEAPQPPKGFDHPILKNVSPEQQQYLASYPQMLGRMLQKIWSVFGKGPFDPIKASMLEDRIVADLDRYFMAKFQKTLNMQEYVMVLGSLAGLQIGTGHIYGKEMSTEQYHAAGQLFEASTRIMSVSTQTALKEQKIVAPAGKKVH